MLPFIDMEKTGRTGLSIKVNEEFCVGHVKFVMPIRYPM